MSLTRTLIRHAPTDYSSIFVRGLPASLDADEVRRYFCDRGFKCTVSFNKINNEYYKLYVALQFDTEKMAREVYNKYDNEQVLGYNVGLSFYKDKARLYRGNENIGSDRMRRARVGQPVDRRRFNRTPSPHSPRRRRRSRSRSRRSRSHSRRSDSDRSQTRSHSGSSSPRRRSYRSSSRDRKKSRTRSFSRSPSRHSWSPKNSRARSKSPKHTDNSKQRKSLSPMGSSRKRHSSRHSLSPSHGASKRDTSKPRSPSPFRSGRARSPRSPTRGSRSPTRGSRSPTRGSRSPTRGSRSPTRRSRSPTRRSRSPTRRSRSPTRGSRKRTSSQTSSASSDRAKTPQESLKRKLSLSPTKSQSVPSPTHSKESSHSRKDSPAKKLQSSSTERTLPDDQHSPDHDDSREEKDKRKEKSSKRKEVRRRSRTPEGKGVSPERQSEVPPKAATLGTSIYGKVGSFTDMNIQQAPETSSSSQRSDKNSGKVPNGSKSRSTANPDDVEEDLRAEFLNNNDALYDSHERMQAAGFPLVTKRKAEKILDDLPIDPLREGQEYISSTVERDFTLSNGDKDARSGGDGKDVWTPEMLNKLKVKKEEIIQAYKQDCDTFSTVVKMLISKDPDLEMRLQRALRENLKEIGQRCVQELHQLADTLKMEAK